MNKIKVALVVDSNKLKAWQHLVVEKIKESEFATIDLVIDCSALPQKKSKKSSILKFYEKYEKKSFKIKNNALAPQDASNLWQTTNTISIEALEMNIAVCAGIDIVINFSSRVDNAKLVEVTDKNVWFYHFGPISGDQNQPQGFWEVMKNQAFTATSLLVQSGSDISVLYESRGPVDSFSMNLTNNVNLWKSASYVPRMLESIAKNGSASYEEKVKTTKISFGNVSKAGGAGLFLPLFNYVKKRIGQKINKTLYHEQWFLLFDLNNDASFDFGKFKKILPPKDRFWADPFIIQRDGNYYIFIEESFFPPKKKGYLSYIVMGEDGGYTEPEKIIEQSYHMSYPHMFEYENDLYMIPESNGGSTIQLYKCTEFPGKWEFQYNIMEDIEAVDTTLLEHDGKWWMFTNIRQNKGASTWDELFLFSSDSPVSKEWTRHPLNPVISDVQRARPAGNIFKEDGKIFRPAQNCSYKYGYGLVINEIIKLSETEFEERVDKSYDPDFDNTTKAVHTYNREGNLTLIDGKLMRPKYW